MIKKTILISLICIFANSAHALTLEGITPVNPLDRNSEIKQNVVIPSFELKRATLTRNSVKNQYAIAMDKFIQSNVRASYIDFRTLIDSVTPNDYVYMRFTREMASIGFFNLAELAMSKIEDEELSQLLEYDVKNFYFTGAKLTHKDQLYLAEIYSNIMYNDQSKEATAELVKNTSLLMESDYANYLAAFGNMKNGNLKQAKEYIDKAIDKNPKNLNYKRLKAEIAAQDGNIKNANNSINSLNSDSLKTVIFDDELHATKEYVLYKTSKNDYLKKYHLAYYYYDKGEYTKSLGVLQTSISGKKNLNKDVYSLTAKVYYKLKEYEKAQDYAKKALDINKTDVFSLEVLGDCAYRIKDYNLALKYYKKAVNKNFDYDVNIKLAKTYQQMNDISKAKEIYTRILKTSAKVYEAYYNMALLESDRRVTYLKKAIAINPDFKDAWIDMAQLELNKDDNEKALSYLNIAKYIDDNYYRYYYYMGLVLKNRGLSAEAHKNFEQSLNLNPDFDLAKKELMNI